jgi:hypothetical protein
MFRTGILRTFRALSRESLKDRTPVFAETLIMNSPEYRLHLSGKALCGLYYRRGQKEPMTGYAHRRTLRASSQTFIQTEQVSPACLYVRHENLFIE